MFICIPDKDRVQLQSKELSSIVALWILSHVSFGFVSDISIIFVLNCIMRLSVKIGKRDC